MTHLIKWLSRGEKSDIIQSGSNFYTRKEFKKVLENERIRSESNNNHLSNLVMNFTQCEYDAKKNYAAFMKNIIYLLEKYTRGSDIKCMYFRAEINILLIDTSIEQGNQMKNRIHDIIHNHFKHKKSLFQTLSSKIEYKLSPIVIASKADNKKHTEFGIQKSVKSNSIAINQ